MHVESQLSVFAGLPVYFFLLSFVLTILQIIQCVIDPEILFVFYLTHVYFLQLVEQIKVVKYLYITIQPYVLVFLEQYLKRRPLLLTLVTGPLPLFHYLFGLTDRGLHYQRGVMRR